MAKYLPTILLILSGLGAAFSTQIQHAVSAHPTAFGAIASVLALVLHWLPAPTSSS